MLKIKNGVIYLTRGDNASLDVTLTDESGNTYTMQSGDKLTLTVRKTPSESSSIILQKTSTTNTITFTHSETQKPIGQYSADIQLTMSDGSVFTVFPEFNDYMMRSESDNWRNFWITPEVTV